MTKLNNDYEQIKAKGYKLKVVVFKNQNGYFGLRAFKEKWLIEGVLFQSSKTGNELVKLMPFAIEKEELGKALKKLNSLLT